MDPIDVKLLDALQANGRLTNAELALMVGLSASQCSRRRMLLEEKGTISGYQATIDELAVGLVITVVVNVRLAAHSLDNRRHFTQLIESLPEVQEAYTLTGENDYMLKMIVPSLETLSRIVNERFLPHPSIAQVRSAIVLDRLKQSSRLPLNHLMQDGKEAHTASGRARTTKAPTRL